MNVCLARDKLIFNLVFGNVNFSGVRSHLVSKPLFFQENLSYRDCSFSVVGLRYAKQACAFLCILIQSPAMYLRSMLFSSITLMWRYFLIKELFVSLPFLIYFDFSFYSSKSMRTSCLCLYLGSLNNE